MLIVSAICAENHRSMLGIPRRDLTLIQCDHALWPKDEFWTRYDSCVTIRPMRQAVRRIAVALVSVALSVPATAAAMSIESAAHEQCRTMGHECGTAVLKSCCCDADRSVPAAPSSTPAGRSAVSGADAAAAPAPPFLASPPIADFVSSLRQLHSPPHGYRSTDLSVLLSVFLI